MKSSDKKLDNASHVYRGYHSQILFILHMILSGDKNQLFHPEGIEDFSVSDNKGLVESIYQIKDLHKPLYVSDLLTKTGNSFFHRCIDYREKYPQSKIHLVYFGELSKDLYSVVERDPNSISMVSSKIANSLRISKTQAEEILRSVVFFSTSTDNLKKSIKTSFERSNLCLDIESSMELLQWWLFEKSEHRQQLSYDNIIKRLTSIGSFISNRSYHHVWLGSIVPLDSLSSGRSEKDLKNDYLEGASARLDHIINNLDVIRSEKLLLIHEKFQNSNIVIIKGASGQGKTSLAYRYLYDSFPTELVYTLKTPENRSHAFTMVESVVNHYKQFDLPVYLYYDVAISDHNWSYIIARLFDIPNLHLLVTIRNEDWQRQSALLSQQVRFLQIDLEFTQEEARSIFSQVPQSSYLDFKSSWIDFGSKGPLLEYIYFLKHGRKLEDRLKEQVVALKKEANTTKIDLLRIVSLASSYGARVYLDKLDILQRTAVPELLLEQLHDEYLIRLESNNSIAEGVHPVRSRLLLNLLIDTTFHPWINSFSSVLPAVVDSDLETFLLYAMLEQHKECTDDMVSRLSSFIPHTWVGFKGVINALLWLGIKRYADENQWIVDKTKKEAPYLDTSLCLDIDIGNLAPEWFKEFRNLLKDRNPKGLAIIENNRSEQTDKHRVFSFVRNWMETQKEFPPVLKNELDYLSFAEISFWWCHLLDQVLQPEIILTHIDNHFEELDISIIAELILAISASNIKWTKAVCKKHREYILEQVSNFYGVFYLEETQNRIKASYILENSDSSLKFRTAPLTSNNDKTVLIATFLRKLYPDKDCYEIQAYPSQILPLFPKYFTIDTYKDMSQKHLPIHYLVQLNSNLLGLLNYKYRASCWDEYSAQIIKIRENICSAFRSLAFGIEGYLKNKDITKIFNQQSKGIINTVGQQLQDIPMFPICSVDPWGFSSELSGAAKVNELAKNNILSLEQYSEYKNKLSDLFTSCLNFLRTFDCFLENRILNKEDLPYVSLWNMQKACTQLPSFQKEFEILFSGTDTSSVKNENKVYENMFISWIAFCFYPNCKFNTSQMKIKIFKNKIITTLNKELTSPYIAYTIHDTYLHTERTLLIVGEISSLPNDLDEELFSEHLLCNLLRRILKKSEKKYRKEEFRILLKFFWDNVSVLFTHNKKLVWPSVKTINIECILNDTSDFFDMPINKDELPANLEITGYWSTPLVDIAQELLESFVKLQASLNHVSALVGVAKEDESNIIEDFFNSYLTNQATSLNSFFKLFIDNIIKISQSIEQFESSDVYKIFCPDLDQEIEGEPEIRDMVIDWCDRLNKNQDIIFNLYTMVLIKLLEE